MKCPFCGSEHIETGISWAKAADSGNVGLSYHAGGFFGVTGVVQVYSDLCLDCKTIIRSYIKEETDKNWNHSPHSMGSR